MSWPSFARLSPLHATHALVAADLSRVALLADAGEWSSTLDDGASVPLAERSSLMGVQVAPFGSRALFFEHEGGHDAPMIDRLIVADLDGPARTELASALGGGYQLAPDGCFAVYDTHLGEAPGTRLALIE